jgi:hypothetical protein
MPFRSRLATLLLSACGPAVVASAPQPAPPLQAPPDAAVSAPPPAPSTSASASASVAETPPPGSLRAIVDAHAGDRTGFTVDAWVLKLDLFPCRCPPNAICGTCRGSWIFLGDAPDADWHAHDARVIRVDVAAEGPAASLVVGTKRTFTLQMLGRGRVELVDVR